MLLIVSAALLAVLLPPLLFDLAFRPIVRRLGLRNAVRRPGEAALVVVGSMLATALITASLIIGDSFGASVRSQASTLFGPTDEVVVVDEPGDAATALTAGNDGSLDGVLAVRYGSVSAGSVSADAAARIAPDLTLLELDPITARTFGLDPEATGLARLPATLADGEAALNTTAADALGVGAGDTIEVYVDAEPVRLSVVDVVARAGLAGFGDIVTAPGQVTDLLEDPDDATVGAVLVSNVGDDLAGADRTDQAVALIQRVLGNDAAIETVKRDLLAEADADSADMTELFGTIGGFSVVAGILLLVNLFVMLAGERRRELGTLQALGLGRSELRRAFSVEGAVYGAVAAVTGAAAGVGVAAVVMRFAADIFADDSAITIGLAIDPLSLLTGAATGLAISQLTVTLTSGRMTRLNIVTALKDAPDPPGIGRAGLWVWLGGLGIVVANVALWAADDVPLVVVVAPALGLLCAVPLVSWFVPRRWALVVLGGAALAATAAVFGLRSDVLDDPELSLFLVQGVLMVALAVVILVTLDQLWVRIVGRLGGGSPAARLGMAHPLDRPIRSGLLVAMYGLVIFTVTFMAVLNAVFQQQVPEFAREAGGSFDVVVDSNPTNPFTTDELTARPDVQLAVPFAQGFVDYSYLDDGEEIADYWWASTVPVDFPAERGPQTVARLDRFGSDTDVWQAVASGDGWITVPAYAGPAPGDQLTIAGPDGEVFDVTVAATTELNWAVDSGFYVPAALTAALTDGYDVVTRHYLVADGDVSAPSLAAAVESDGRRRGAVARTFVSIAQADVDEQQAFLRLLQGYLGLGLLIGIAGLGVVLVRAVRERRRQLGMMAAVGIDRSVLRNMFVIEAAFIGLQGVALGIGLGLLSSWQVLTRSTAFEDNLGFAVPWTWLAALAAVSLTASLVAGLLPAIRASRVLPAVALRITS